MKAPAIDWHRFAAAVERKVYGEDNTLRDLQAITGVSATTLCRITMGCRCTAEHFLAVCRWLRRDPMDFFRAGGLP